jgi:hypothetical protein
MSDSTPDAAQEFDVTRAAEYETQSRIALAGYDACHELAACMLAAVLGKFRCIRSKKLYFALPTLYPCKSPGVFG